MHLIYGITFGVFAGAFIFERQDYLLAIICIFLALLFGFASLNENEHEKSVK